MKYIIVCPNCQSKNLDADEYTFKCLDCNEIFDVADINYKKENN